jgi:hypothetical protein
MSRWQLFRNATQNRCTAGGAFWPLADIKLKVAVSVIGVKADYFGRHSTLSKRSTNPPRDRDISRVCVSRRLAACGSRTGRLAIPQ